VNITPRPHAQENNPAVTLYSLEKKLKEVSAGLEDLRAALIAEPKEPDCLLTEISSSKKFLTVSDMCAFFQADKKTIYHLRHKGLPSYKIGKDLRFDPLEVREWIRARNQ
jgi:predicted DNA-binding transcriptional regulator AlpA